MESPQKKQSLFSRISAKKFFIIALISFALDLIISIATQNSYPSSKAEALIPGLLMGILGWVAIICLIAGIVKWLRSRKK